MLQHNYVHIICEHTQIFIPAFAYQLKNMETAVETPSGICKDVTSVRKEKMEHTSTHIPAIFTTPGGNANNCYKYCHRMLKGSTITAGCVIQETRTGFTLLLATGRTAVQHTSPGSVSTARTSRARMGMCKPSVVAFQVQFDPVAASGIPAPAPAPSVRLVAICWPVDDHTKPLREMVYDGNTGYIYAVNGSDVITVLKFTAEELETDDHVATPAVLAVQHTLVCAGLTRATSVALVSGNVVVVETPRRWSGVGLKPDNTTLPPRQSTLLLFPVLPEGGPTTTPVFISDIVALPVASLVSSDPSRRFEAAYVSFVVAGEDHPGHGYSTTLLIVTRNPRYERSRQAWRVDITDLRHPKASFLIPRMDSLLLIPVGKTMFIVAADGIPYVFEDDGSVYNLPGRCQSKLQFKTTTGIVCLDHDPETQARLDGGECDTPLGFTVGMKLYTVNFNDDALTPTNILGM